MIKIKEKLNQERLDVLNIDVTDGMTDTGGSEIFYSGLNWEFCAATAQELAANICRVMEAAERGAASRTTGKIIATQEENIGYEEGIEVTEKMIDARAAVASGYDLAGCEMDERENARCRVGDVYVVMKQVRRGLRQRAGIKKIIWQAGNNHGHWHRNKRRRSN